MRTVATGLVCVLVAFGAAFLITRAVDHTTTARGATAARLPAVPSVTVPAGDDSALAAQFAPEQVALRKPAPKPKPHHRHVAAPPAPAPAAPQAAPVTSTPPAPTYTAPVTPAPTYTAPAYTAPAPTYTPASPVTSSSHKSSGSGSGSGSGTTVIGG